jgi:hypothetical protein
MKSFLIILLLLFASFSIGYAVNDTSITRAKTSGKIIVDSSPELDLANNCKKIEEVYIILSEAIGIGAPTYNEGNHIGCYRIYEGAAYKILYKYGNKCKEVTKILETALEKSYGDYNSTEKAWIMRKAFDQILGAPTIYK